MSARQSVEKLSDLSDLGEDEDAINVDVMRDYQVSQQEGYIFYFIFQDSS